MLRLCSYYEKRRHDRAKKAAHHRERRTRWWVVAFGCWGHKTVWNHKDPSESSIIISKQLDLERKWADNFTIVNSFTCDRQGWKSLWNLISTAARLWDGTFAFAFDGIFASVEIFHRERSPSSNPPLCCIYICRLQSLCLGQIQTGSVAKPANIWFWIRKGIQRLLLVLATAMLIRY